MNNRSRLIALLLVLVMTFSSVACAAEGGIPVEKMNADAYGVMLTSAQELAASEDVVVGWGMVNADAVQLCSNHYLPGYSLVQSELLDELAKDTLVTVCEGEYSGFVSKQWRKVSFNGITGYIMSEYLTLCSCNVAEGAGLDAHSESCPDKTYYVRVCALTAEEIYAGWNSYTEAGRAFVELYLSRHYQAKLAQLKGMLEAPGEVTLLDGMTVIAKGLPEGAVLKAEYLSEQRVNAADELMSDTLYMTPASERTHYLQKALNISVQKGGEEWQPAQGERVDIEIDLDIDWLNDDSNVWVTHILDTKEAIENASGKGSYYKSGISAVYPDECAAAQDAGYGEDTIVYVNLNAGNGGISYDHSGKLTIHASSFSDHILMLYNLDDSEHLPPLKASKQEVVVNKEADFNQETGTGMISIDAYVTGEITSVPTDVVLVIDQSGSMWTSIKNGNDGMVAYNAMDKNKGEYAGYYACITENTNAAGYYGAALVRYNNTKNQWEQSAISYATRGNQVQLNEGGSGIFRGYINITLDDKTWTKIEDPDNYVFYKTITGALHDALYAFRDSVINAEKCRVAVATFAGTSSDYNGSGIFANGNLVPHTNIGVGFDYSSAFVAPGELSGIYEKIHTNFGHTPTGLGLHYAKELLENSGRQEENPNRVVIVFTDGYPSSSGYRDYASYTQELKNIGATVYSLGPQSADANVKKVLETIASDKGGYFVADDSSLRETFKKIANIIVENSKKLHKESVFTDVMAPSFKLPAGITKDQVDVYTIDHTSSGFDIKTKAKFNEAVITVDETTNTVSVLGFDFSQNSVAEGINGGKKLVIEFPYVLIDGFLGGDDIPTNDTSSGIYNLDKREEPFNEPVVDVNLRQPIPGVRDDAIYVSQNTDLRDLINKNFFKIAGSDTQYTIDGKVNGYVDIEYKITDESGNYMTLTIPAGAKSEDLASLVWNTDGGLTPQQALTEDNARYTIASKVTSKNDNSNVLPTEGTTDPNAQSAEVRVYKPVIAFKDSVINSGVVPNYERDNLVSVLWKYNGNEPDEAEKQLLGNAPEMLYTYQPAAAASPTDIRVQVTEVKAGGVTILPHVTFMRDACESCGTTEQEVNHKGVEEWLDFIVHIGRFNLKIEKTGLSSLDMDSDETQSTMYKVTNDAGFELMVAIDQNGYVTIKDLPFGEYEVTELTDWSWRYTPAGSAVTQTVQPQAAVDGVVTVTFNNDRTNPQWLSGDSYGENTFSVNGNVSAEGSLIRTDGGE